MLYILGDVIDRHPGGVRILRRIMAADNMKLVLGNHEYMMLEALGYSYDSNGTCACKVNESALKLWYRNGGKVTHDYLKRLRKSLRAEVIQYLLEAPLRVDVEVDRKKYTLVHAAAVEDSACSTRYETPTQFAVWNRWHPTNDLPVLGWD